MTIDSTMAAFGEAFLETTDSVNGVVSVQTDGQDRRVLELLNRLGRQGWQLVAVDASEDERFKKFWLKRRLS